MSKKSSAPFALLATAGLLALLTGCGGGGADGGSGATVGTAGQGAEADLASSAAKAKTNVGPTSTPGPTTSTPTATKAAAATETVSVLPSASAHATPKVGAIQYGRMSLTQQAAAARFQFVVLNQYASIGQAGMQSAISMMRQINPTIKLAQYVLNMEYQGSAASNEDAYPVVQALDANGWWALDAGGQRVQWTDMYGAWLVNITRWAPLDAQGRRWSQWKAQHDTATLLGTVSGLDYVFVDNVMGQPRNDLDWKRNGTTQLRTDPEIQAATRQGMVDYFNDLRALNPGKKIIGNADNDLSSPEYKGQLDGAFLECQMGKSWSLETWAGWTPMMTRYRATLANTRARDVVFQLCLPEVNLTTMRYGLASSMLEDGYFAYTVAGMTTPYWADEFSAPIGTAAEAPPTAPTASGVWTRKYTNGIVLVNPQAVSATVSIGAGYKRLTGTQDPAVNNGAAQSSVTLGPRQGLLMVRT